MVRYCPEARAEGFAFMVGTEGKAREVGKGKKLVAVVRGVLLGGCGPAAEVGGRCGGGPAGHGPINVVVPWWGQRH